MMALYRAEAAAALAHLDALGRRMERLLRENAELRAEVARLKVTRGRQVSAEYPAYEPLEKQAG